MNQKGGMLHPHAASDCEPTLVDNHGLSVDFLFSRTKSKDTEQCKDYVKINNTTSAILILDHFTPNLAGDPRISKGSLLWF